MRYASNMRTRQPALLALTGKEIASSNSTLNTLLGGRQKAWMTGSGNDVRPTPRAQGTQRFSLSVLPSPAPSDEPSPEQLAMPRNPSLDAQQAAPQPHSRPQPPSQLLLNHDHRQPNSVLVARDQAGTKPQTSPINAPQSYGRPESETMRLQQPQANKRQKKMPSSSSSNPSLASRTMLLEEHIQNNGGWDSLGLNVEKPRFILLFEACRNDDYFFLVLHQVLCLWSVDAKEVTRLDGFDDQSAIAKAFELICSLIRGNDGISQIHLNWLAQFPSPLNDPITRSDHYHRTLSAVRIFLLRTATEKISIVEQCQQRGYPPLVDEMVSRLGLLSPLLQGIFFTACRRNLGMCEDDSQMEKLFLTDRDGYNLLATRLNSAFPPSEREILERNAWLAKQYLEMRSVGNRQIQSSISANSPVEPSPRLGSFPSPQLDTTSPQGAFLNNAPPQFSNITGVFQNQNQQTSLNGATNLPTAFLSYAPPPSLQNGENSQRGIIASASPGPINIYQQSPSYDSPSYSISQQQLRGHPGPASPILRSNLSQSLSSMHATDSYAGSAPVSQMQQHTVYHQNSPTVQQSYGMYLPNHQQQHLLQRQNRQRNFNPMTINSQAANMQRGRVNSVPSISPMNRTPVSRGPTMNQPSIPSTSRHASGRANGPVLKSPNDPLRMIIPPQGQSLSVHQPNPDFTAAHQAYLRSPILESVDIPLQLEEGDPARRRYQAVLDFAVGPVALSRTLPLSVFEFIVPDIIFAKISTDRMISRTSPTVREVKQGDIQYRMRCVQIKAGEVEKATDYVVADTVWPDCIFMEVNGTPIEVRRRLHHGKDLPADITGHILPVAANVTNKVKVSFPRLKKAPKDVDYSFAVEVVEVLKHQQILDMCRANPHISAEQTIENIKASLSGTLIDDDEISMEVGDLTINLADPFMARIFDIPVRGSNCLHRDSFDLETFLKTRQSKPKFPHQPSMVDVWKCPLCGKDARPYSLQIDEFLVSVRQKLAEQGLLDTKAIVISADGSWTPKPEAMPRKRSAYSAGLDDDDVYNNFDNMVTTVPALTSTKPKELEIIEIDDD